MGMANDPKVIANNDIGLDGMEFIEFSSLQPERLHRLFSEFGFSLVARHDARQVDHYNQNEIHFLLNREPSSYAVRFSEKHGPCASAMGWRVKDAKKALQLAIERGATECEEGDLKDTSGRPVPAIYGIGESLIYFIDNYTDPNRYQRWGFKKLAKPNLVQSKGFMYIDHLTNNVHKGTMAEWSNFYKNIFGFTEIRYFDIRGVQTGLQSFALKSPCGKFCIPINEATEKESQINEFIRDYKGPGIQHIALCTEDIVDTVAQMKTTSVETLDIDNEYYQTVFDRVPNVTEDHKRLQDLQILVDGDDEGYLLQIFTKNLIGPIFFEIIQRKNHYNFGEGNFGALFRSIERDQKKRGVL